MGNYHKCLPVSKIDKELGFISIWLVTIERLKTYTIRQQNIRPIMSQFFTPKNPIKPFVRIPAA